MQTKDMSVPPEKTHSPVLIFASTTLPRHCQDETRETRSPHPQELSPSFAEIVVLNLMIAMYAFWTYFAPSISQK